jgi:serine/threonine-protein kinase HipA
MARVLRVLLGDRPVGRLTLDSQDGCDFRLMESYKRAYPRPVLGQVFLDDLDQIWRSRARVAPWFSNVLPEGPLRELIARQAGVSVTREFFLLHHLGKDLPGAVRIVADDSEAESQGDEGDQPDETGGEDSDAWHFSLAGVQWIRFFPRPPARDCRLPSRRPAGGCGKKRVERSRGVARQRYGN